MFPIGLPDFLVRAFTDPGELVFEPFAGSGSTLIACEELGRPCRAIELAPAYCDAILARWELFAGAKAKRVNP